MSVLDEMALGTRKYHKEVAKICEPIKQFFGITHVGYVEINNEGRLINIHTCAPWIDRCLEKEYHQDDPHMISPDNMGSGFALWSSYKPDYYHQGLLRELVDSYEQAHGITYIHKTEQGYKAFGLATAKENLQLHNKLISEISIVKKFIHYLDEKLDPIRRDLDDHRIDFSELKGSAYFEQKGLIQPIPDLAKQYRFLHQLGLVDDKLKDVQLSKREQQCIRLYLDGNSATQTAKKLFLSPRTIESHMDNIKTKLNLKFKRELFDKAQTLKELSLI